MTAGPRFDQYEWEGGREAMLRFGPDAGPLVVAAMPLLEEANRTRAFLVSILRALAQRGIGGMLPDLPGQGESMLPTESMTWGGLRSAFAAAARSSGERRTYAVTIRSAALVDGDVRLAGRWRFAPQDGADLATEWRRLRRAGAAGQHSEVAGNLVSGAFRADLDVPLVPPDGPLRTVRLTTDPRPANRTVDGAPLWRRSEPGNDPALAGLLADDIAWWIARCEG